MPKVQCEDAPCCGCCGPNGDDAEQWTGERYEGFWFEFNYDNRED